MGILLFIFVKAEMNVFTMNIAIYLCIATQTFTHSYSIKHTKKRCDICSKTPERH